MVLDGGLCPKVLATHRNIHAHRSFWFPDGFGNLLAISKPGGLGDRRQHGEDFGIRSGLCWSGAVSVGDFRTANTVVHAHHHEGGQQNSQ